MPEASVEQETASISREVSDDKNQGEQNDDCGPPQPNITNNQHGIFNFARMKSRSLKGKNKLSEVSINSR